MAKESRTRANTAARHGAKNRSTDPRDDLWAGIIRHRDRVRAFTRPVKGPAAEKAAAKNRMTA